MDIPVTALSGRRILLGVSGGIAAYKAADLVRRLREVGAEVRVVMTAHAEAFVAPMTFQALTGQPVRQALFDPAHEAAMGHIELARWPDLVLVAPATANLMAKCAQGLADDLLSTLLLASDRPLALVPAMNRLMWGHPATQANVMTLKGRGVHLLGPGQGDQACGETGEGRMLEPLAIRDAVIGLLSTEGPLSGCRVVVSAGPTREPVDPVRFISNRSSGKQGFAVAAALQALGADVTLVAGPVTLPTPAGVRRVDVDTAESMLAAATEAVQGAHIFVSAAAVADYRVATAATRKIKKHDDTLPLMLVKNPDILSTIRAANPALFMVGFAAETDDLESHARGKLERKGLQMIAANWVGDGRAFEVDHNALQVFWAGGGQAIPEAGKATVARTLAALIADRYRAQAA